MTNLLNLK